MRWSINGARLFSGDKSGLVAATEVDFFQNSVTSRVVVRSSGDNFNAYDDGNDTDDQVHPSLPWTTP